MSYLSQFVDSNSPLAYLIPWFPMLLKGFGVNLLISVLCMLFGSIFGIFLGAAQLARTKFISVPARVLTQLLRNSPWLVIMFYVMYLLPFELQFKWGYVTIPDWMKAVIALAIPVSGYTSEIVRGGLRSIPYAQWEAATSLAFGPIATLRQIILPQAFRRMLPPMMNLYCSATMATSLANIVGVSEAVTVTQSILSTVQKPGVLLPAYGVLLLLFFAYVYPISLLSGTIERRWARSEK